MRLAIEVRRPSHAQEKDSGAWDAVHSRRRVATVVLRNISKRHCFAGSGEFALTIVDRVGEIVGRWDDPADYFAYYYQPGDYHTFSLPSVDRCDRPGPFTALAIVGRLTARRTGLRRSDITCS
jgi:hypothetical protein